MLSHSPPGPAVRRATAQGRRGAHKEDAQARAQTLKEAGTPKGAPTREEEGASVEGPGRREHPGQLGPNPGSRRLAV